MLYLNYWHILTVIAIISLFIFWKKLNFVWIGLTAGGFIGLVLSFIHYFENKNFDWDATLKITVAATIAGTVIEIIGRATHLIKTPKHVTKKHH
jgi:hypothetical protein